MEAVNKVIHLILAEGSELELVTTSKQYFILKEEYLKYMKKGEQDSFLFFFPNNAELLINFDEIVSILCENKIEEFNEFDD